MKILQTIQDDDTLFVFTDNPEEDIKYFLSRYNDEDCEIQMWYEIPVLYTYWFLWKKYRCISMWFDKEISFLEETRNFLNKLIK